MKIYLEDKNKRKIVYDILNIFFDHAEINFVESEMKADIKIKKDLLNIAGKDYKFKTNQDIKALLYDYLAEKTGYKSPWGTLTGSKPSKLLKSKSLTEIKDNYKVSDEKLELLDLY